MAKWVGLFVNNLDGKSVRELEVEADDEVTAMMLLDLYDYDETWQHYSFVDLQKKTVEDIPTRSTRLHKEQKPLWVPLVQGNIKSVLFALICVQCFSCFCLWKSAFYYGQSPEFNRNGFQVNCNDRTPSKQKENTYQYALQWLALND